MTTMIHLRSNTHGCKLIKRYEKHPILIKIKINLKNNEQNKINFSKSN